MANFVAVTLHRSLAHVEEADMFDLITGKVQHAPRHQAVSVLVSVATQVAIASTIVMATLLVVCLLYTSPSPRDS